MTWYLYFTRPLLYSKGVGGARLNSTLDTTHVSYQDCFTYSRTQWNTFNKHLYTSVCPCVLCSLIRRCQCYLWSHSGVRVSAVSNVTVATHVACGRYSTQSRYSVCHKYISLTSWSDLTTEHGTSPAGKPYSLLKTMWKISSLVRAAVNTSLKWQGLSSMKLWMTCQPSCGCGKLTIVSTRD